MATNPGNRDNYNAMTMKVKLCMVSGCLQWKLKLLWVCCRISVEFIYILINTWPSQEDTFESIFQPQRRYLSIFLCKRVVNLATG